MENQSWETSLREVNSATSIEDLDATLARMAKELGSNCHAYFCGTLVHDIRQQPGTIFQSHPTCLHRYPPAWQERYYAEGYYRDDPVIVAGLRSVLPVRWSDLARTATGRARQIMDEAREHGLRAGVSVAVHGAGRSFSMLSMAFAADGDEIESHIDRSVHCIHLLCLHLHAAVLRVEAAKAPVADTVRLTPREREILRWMANGKTYVQIGQILGITERTVREHLDRAANKLGVDSKMQLVTEAVARGLTLS